MKTIIIKRYDIVRAINTGEFSLVGHEKNSKEKYPLNATSWEEAEQEAYNKYYEKLKQENQNCIIAID